MQPRTLLFRFPFGFKEVKESIPHGLDLKRHQSFSGKKIQYFDPELNESYVPYVIETSIGVDRMFLQILSAAYTEEEIEKEDGSKDSRVVLKLPPALAPIKLAVMPLVKKDGYPKAEEIMKLLRLDFRCQYDEKTLSVNAIAAKMPSEPQGSVLLPSTTRRWKTTP